MSEVWLRLTILLAGALVVATVAFLMHRRATGPGAVRAHGLAPGVYFFASATCADCAPARSRLDAALGRDGYREVRWEDDPDVFAALDVDMVPCTVLVSEEGVALKFPGSPEPALQELNP